MELQTIKMSTCKQKSVPVNYKIATSWKMVQKENQNNIKTIDLNQNIKTEKLT